MNYNVVCVMSNLRNLLEIPLNEASRRKLWFKGSAFFGTPSFRPRRNTASKKSRRSAKRSKSRRAVISDAAKVASRGTYANKSNELMYGNWLAIAGVTYIYSVLCNSATELPTIAKFTYARTIQFFLVPHYLHALCRSFVARESSCRCERPCDPAPSSAGPVNWGS